MVTGLAFPLSALTAEHLSFIIFLSLVLLVTAHYKRTSCIYTCHFYSLVLFCFFVCSPSFEVVSVQFQQPRYFGHFSMSTWQVSTKVIIFFFFLILKACHPALSCLESGHIHHS